MRPLVASASVLLFLACARSRPPAERFSLDADCQLERARVTPPDTVDWKGRPRCRAVFVGDTAIRLGIALPLAGDSTLWERRSDSVFALRSPERFGAGYVRVYIGPTGWVRAVHYEIIRRDWPPTRIGIRKACTPMSVCQIVDPSDTTHVVKWVGDSLVQYDRWTWNAEWSPGQGPNHGPIRGVLLDRAGSSRLPPHN